MTYTTTVTACDLRVGDTIRDDFRADARVLDISQAGASVRVRVQDTRHRFRPYYTYLRADQDVTVLVTVKEASDG